MAEQDDKDPVTLVSTTEEGKKIGRPRKKDIAAKTPGKMAKRGRPPGEAAAMAEFKARLLNSPKSRKVIDSIINAALDDDHKNQAAAWRIIADRLLPMASFEDSLKSGKSAITINISGIGAEISTANEVEDNYIDGELEE